MIRYLSVFLCLMLANACAPKTTVILLPQEDGTTGSVVVKTQSSSTILDKPYTYATIDKDKSDYSVNSIDKHEVADKYQRLVEAELVKPVSFILYFQTGSTKLAQKSMALIPEVLKSIKKREPSEVSVIGHTDSKGSKEYNIKLSLQRANAVAKILKEFDADLKNLLVQSYGENDPLVVTEDNVSEERNRRVEIMIR